jgi:hypothetical protein
LKDFFMAKEIFLLADLESLDNSRHGTPVSLIHSMLRTYFGDNGVDWGAYLLGGLLGKTITEALKQRLAAGEKPNADQGELLSGPENILSWDVRNLVCIYALLQYVPAAIVPAF